MSLFRGIPYDMLIELGRQGMTINSPFLYHARYVVHPTNTAAKLTGKQDRSTARVGGFNPELVRLRRRSAPEALNLVIKPVYKDLMIYKEASRGRGSESECRKPIRHLQAQLQLQFGPVTVRSGLIRASILDAIRRNLFVQDTQLLYVLREHAPLGQTRHTWGRRKNSQRVKAVRKTVRDPGAKDPPAIDAMDKTVWSVGRPLRRENKRFFWEPASYDDLSARFNGVPFNVAVTTLDVDPRSYPRLCTRIPSNSLFSVCSYTRTNL
ncbi:hypothetical protein EAG_12740 [Camponotus floridanus]|uniref:Uncharacterized protein n=1 Tax=Camponotus floridanus TaxID=104421 RepID=E2AZE2_CAMFO|nr:hypothetical protein EAG_12740 [Camponotus floridanus]